LPYVNEPNIGGWASFTQYQNGYLAQRYLQYLQIGATADVSMFSQYRRLPVILSRFLDPRPETRITLAEAFQNSWFELAQSGAPQAPLGDDVAELLQGRAAKNALHIFLLDMIGRKLQGESLNYYREMWDQYDTDNSGQLDFEEFEQMVEENGLTNAKTSAKHLFKLADYDGNGTVSFNNFVALMFNPDNLEEEEKIRYFASVFHEIAGEDGLIEFGELADQFPEVDRRTVQNFFNQIDEDGNGYISVEEFKEYLEQL